MRGRKILSALLSAALTVALAAPALAETQSADQALVAVTAKVKATLALDTELFTEFQGYADEDVLLGKRWNLEWSGDGVWLSITADDSGKIYSYNRSESVSDPVVMEDRYMGGKLNIPRLPEDKSQAAHQTAVNFLNKVLETPVETVELENNYSPSLRQSTYRYSGQVLLNGLESPIKCSVTVRASDLAVTRFWRTDQSSGYLGGVPAAATSVSGATARLALTGTVEMKARYVLGEDGKTAKVQYLPVYGDDYYVDGVTGKLVNLTELRKKLWESGGSANKVMYTNAAMDTAAPEAAMDLAAGLTQAEKDGAAILEGALSKEELDKIVQNAWPEIGLDQYTLASASYSLSKKDLPDGQGRTNQDYDITCRLTYGKQEGQVSRNKYLTVDAKTGKLQSLYSRRYYRGEGKETLRYANTLLQSQAKADAILQAFAGKNYAVMGLFDSLDAQAHEGWEHTYSYQHTDGTYFYDGNSYTVGVDALDGTISQLSGYFNEDVVLDTPDSVISAQKATEIYANAMAMPYSYLEVPVSISLAPSDVMPLLKEAGYSFVLALKTGYTLTQPKNQYISGVDAQTGEVVKHDYTPGEREGITYDDIQGHWTAQAADALAVFDIGLRGGSLKPGDTLIQVDMIALLASVDGYAYDPTAASKEETDWLYNHAYSLGLVTPETRNESKAVTRGELVRVILDAAGYERVAALPGIFRCDFADSAAIPAGEMGYAALAQGLGLVKGGSDGSYAAGRAATRAEAIAMLYQYMK